MLLLDTHVLIWFAEDNPRLGARATKLTDAALHRGEVLVSAKGDRSVFALHLT